MQWLGAIKLQVIAWAKVDPDLHGHISSQGHNELRIFKHIVAMCDAFVMSVYCDDCTHYIFNSILSGIYQSWF